MSEKLNTALRPDLPSLEPRIITLQEHLNSEADQLKRLPYPGLLAQGDYMVAGMAIRPTQEQLHILLVDEGLTEADHEKYSATVDKLVKSGRVNIELNYQSTLEDILKFCLGGIWLITGKHDEQQASIQIGLGEIQARKLVDFDNPPITKCNFFNSSFAYLFYAVCKYFNRQDLLDKYQFFIIHSSATHSCLGLTSMKDGQYRITVIDPYHTTSRNTILNDGIDLDLLFSKLDKTQERQSVIMPSFEEATKIPSGATVWIS